MYSQLIGIYEDRKKRLSGILSSRSDLRDDSKNQIQGAINEIEHFVKLLRQYQDLSNSNSISSNGGFDSNMHIPPELATPKLNLPKGTLFSKIFGR